MFVTANQGANEYFVSEDRVRVCRAAGVRIVYPIEFVCVDGNEVYLSFCASTGAGPGVKVVICSWFEKGIKDFHIDFFGKVGKAGAIAGFVGFPNCVLSYGFCFVIASNLSVIVHTPDVCLNFVCTFVYIVVQVFPEFFAVCFVVAAVGGVGVR